MAQELDWDSVDSGRLHRSTSAARTTDGLDVIVGALDQVGRLAEWLTDADDERRYAGLPQGTQRWLYVPVGLPLPAVVDGALIVKRVVDPNRP